MAINILKSEERGLIENDVFKGQTIFSNGIHSTTRPESFGTVYVFNDDVLYPQSFLGMHPHKNVEIVTILISGTESHADTLGIHENYTAGHVQLISSGKGLYHQGGNDSTVSSARHLQIWIAPKTLNTKPKVAVKMKTINNNGLELLVSPNTAHESLKINQEAWIFDGKFNLNEKAGYRMHSPRNGVMVYLISGDLEINARSIKEGDTAFITDEPSIELVSKNKDTNFILIETIL